MSSYHEWCLKMLYRSELCARLPGLGGRPAAQQPPPLRAPIAPMHRMSSACLAFCAAEAGEDAEGEAAGMGGQPIMVLDEMDSGVGGRLGSPVAAMLRRMAAPGTGTHQILCVSHLPQVTAYTSRPVVRPCCAAWPHPAQAVFRSAHCITLLRSPVLAAPLISMYSDGLWTKAD